MRFCPWRSSSPEKVVGATVLNLQSPFLVTVDDPMKVEAAKEGLDLVSLHPALSVATELQHWGIDLVVMTPVDQAYLPPNCVKPASSR
jgi:hypothetical protein